jgi:hypothetical protein
MRTSDGYISMSYRDDCADDYGDAQFALSNINGLGAELRTPFILIFSQQTLRHLQFRHFSGKRTVHRLAAFSQAHECAGSVIADDARLRRSIG